ncbi:probable cytochrome P450 9f2 [Uranotaenia lowii]|uniref:probable cytochrome P450 9f2 n=1 Tax=Uranotaenia lowii TaxID=190385 RepID=UPI00247975AA|nr:probable cytochrome P450 9f2 [Uranotaenia lowii]
MGWFEWLTALLIVVSLLYHWSTGTYRYFKKKGVAFVEPYPLLGSLWPVFFRRIHPTDVITRGYRRFPDRKFSGYFEFRKPTVLLHDPELVKQITIKDFDNFPDHANVCPIEIDPLLGRALFFSGDQLWREARSGQSPAFTGSKMRNMFGLIDTYMENATKRLLVDAGGGKSEREAKDLISKLGNDVMASVSFGVDIDSIHDPGNDYYQQGLRLAATSGFQGLKFFLLTVLPANLFRLFGIRFMPKSCTDFYVNVINKTIDHREKNNIKRPDFIHLFMQARKNLLVTDQADDQLNSVGFSTVQEHLTGSIENSRFTDLDIAAMAGAFIFAGIETTTSTLCFALYELALNLEIQEKLLCEIDTTHKNLGKSKLTYEVLQTMPFLDAVVSETLRKWPPIGVTNRVCNRPYTLKDLDGSKFTIAKGQVVQIPIVSFHRDPKYFSEPNNFLPTRFSPENRHLINQSTYLPFGVGPRNCIGSRLALAQVKCVLYHLMVNFVVEFSPKMMVPVELDPSSTAMTARGGFWFNFVPR